MVIHELVMAAGAVKTSSDSTSVSELSSWQLASTLYSVLFTNVIDLQFLTPEDFFEILVLRLLRNL